MGSAESRPAPASALATAQACAALVRRSAASTVASLFDQQARLYSARPALEQGQRRLTFGEVQGRTRRLAGALAGRGVAHGSRVAILSENRLEFLELFIAAARTARSTLWIASSK